VNCNGHCGYVCKKELPTFTIFFARLGKEFLNVFETQYHDSLAIVIKSTKASFTFGFTLVLGFIKMNLMSKLVYCFPGIQLGRNIQRILCVIIP
jgi:hypothetical protein